MNINQPSKRLDAKSNNLPKNPFVLSAMTDPVLLPKQSDPVKPDSASQKK